MRCCDQHCCTFAVHKTVEGKASAVEGEASAGREVAEQKLQNFEAADGPDGGLI
jgi:hypothetical protein